MEARGQQRPRNRWGAPRLLLATDAAVRPGCSLRAPWPHPLAPSRTRLKPSRHTELFQVLKILLSLQFLWTAHGCLPLSRCPEAPSWPGAARSPQRPPEGGPRHFGVGPCGAGRVRLGRAPPWGLSAPCTSCAKRGCGKQRRPHAAVAGARRCAAQGALRMLGVRLTK